MESNNLPKAYLRSPGSTQGCSLPTGLALGTGSSQVPRESRPYFGTNSWSSEKILSQG